MRKEARFVGRFKSRQEATLFYNEIQKQLKKERSCNGFAEYEHIGYWRENGGLLVTVCFKDPKTLEEVMQMTPLEIEWKLLPDCYTLDDLLKLGWS